MDHWLKVELTVPAAAVAAVADAFQTLGALSLSLSDPGDNPILEPAPGTEPLWPEVTVCALLPPDTRNDAVEASLGLALRQPLPPISCGLLRERDWIGEFRENLKPLRFGRRLWICPVGTSCPDVNGVAVELEPGLAFGSGSHPTTRMCLEWLAGLDLCGCSVLDWGCGSGILAIAALALGANGATAIDIDPQALQATRDNAQHNGCLAGLRVVEPAQLPGRERYDVVIANIVAQVVIDLAPRLSRCCRTGARVALSGILTTQAAKVRGACAPWLDLHVAGELDGWVLLAGVSDGTE